MKFNEILFSFNQVCILMIRRISTSIVQAFSIHNKTQNFFEMNPIYPDFGDKNFDIYNSERKKINVVDAHLKQQRRNLGNHRLVRQRILVPKYDKFKRYSEGKKLIMDKSTNLPIGMNSDFDDFVEFYKRELYMDQTAKSEFKQTLIKLIYRFKCKSETELIRLFRISVANSKKKGLLDKIRGQVLQDALLKTARSFLPEKKPQVIEDPEDQQQQAFQMALKEIDDRIAKAEETLRYKPNGIQKNMSKYDSKYGWMETHQEIIDEDAELGIPLQPTRTIQISSSPNSSNLQDWSIKTRINRLYFLKRLQFLKQQKDQFQDLKFFQQLPINIRDRDKIMNEIAHQYKQSELIQQPDLQQIYREIDAMVDKVYVNISPGSKNKTKKETTEQIYDKSPQVGQYLWQNIQAEEILCDTMYNNRATNEVVLTDQYLRQFSPSSHTELTLTKIPINLYRHSELEIFGIFNQYRKKLASNLLTVEEVDFEPQFSQFSLETARRKYKRIQAQFVERGKTQTGKARRKTAYAEASIKKGTGIVTINGKSIQDYFGDTFHRVQALKPLIITDTSGMYDVTLNVCGSGSHGQSEAMAYALAKALMKTNPQHKRILACFGLVGHDFRKKEPKKTNLYSARVRPPYVRR